MKMIILWYIVCSAFLYASADATKYKIGVGRADCTGPPVEVVFMGYANPGQRGEGLHLRQFARSFIVSNNGNSVVFVTIDAAMVSIAVKLAVIERLKQKYGNLYTSENVVISGTHSHSTPGGFMMYLLYDLSTFGFVKETHRAYIDGIFNSIDRAHLNLQDGYLHIDQIDVLNASINRSPSAYDNNPAEEKAQYKYNTDKTLTQLRFVNKSNEIIGAINWFAVHPTSMNNTNRMVSTDNVGFASILFEQYMSPKNLPGKGRFVGAFASSNLGDVSPNIMGPKCEYTGDPCDILTSSCPKGHGHCFASGPGKNQFESTKIIANRLSKAAIKLIKRLGGRKVSGEVKSIHQYIDMTKAKGVYYNPKRKSMETVRGCMPAMGYSFAAGTTDGPGAFDFRQGTTTDNPLWNIARDFLAEPTAEDVQCQSPKPILLATGRINFPYDWQPKILPTQLLQIGDVMIAAVPGEMTTMSGRRLRNSIRTAVLQESAEDVQVIIAGLSNMYSSYIATPEEYQIQRYEGASTIFGPHTLTLYQDQYEKLIQSMLGNKSIDAGPSPPYLDDSVMSLQPVVIYDGKPMGKSYGDVTRQPLLKYTIGEVASVEFISGNPRNNLQHEKTYFSIETLHDENTWEIIYADANWETSFSWRQTHLILGHSVLQVYWYIPPGTQNGIYRIRHYGSARNIFGGYHNYIGTSRTFNVTS